MTRTSHPEQVARLALRAAAEERPETVARRRAALEGQRLVVQAVVERLEPRAGAAEQVEAAAEQVEAAAAGQVEAAAAQAGSKNGGAGTEPTPPPARRAAA